MMDVFVCVCLCMYVCVCASVPVCALCIFDEFTISDDCPLALAHGIIGLPASTVYDDLVLESTLNQSHQ